MKETATGNTDEAIGRERAAYRAIFCSAAGKYRSLVHGSKVKVQNPERFGPPGSGVRFDSVLWCRDFELTGLHALKGLYGEVFSLRYVRGYSQERTMRALAMAMCDDDAFKAWLRAIEEIVGKELYVQRIWPVSEYVNRKAR